MVQLISDLSGDGYSNYIMKCITGNLQNAIYCEKCNAVFKFDDEDIVEDNDHYHINCCICGNSIELKRDISTKETNRGFKYIQFKDAGGDICSLQESSSIDPKIWFGKENVPVKVFLPDIDESKKGWIDFPLPECVKIFGRMELSQAQVKELLPYLEYFSIYGHLPKNMINETSTDDLSVKGANFSESDINNKEMSIEFNCFAHTHNIEEMAKTLTESLYIDWE